MTGFLGNANLPERAFSSTSAQAPLSSIKASKGLPIEGGILAMHWLKPDRSFVCKQA